MRIAICDDLVEQLNILEAALKAYFKLNPKFVKIELFQHAFDFLDIQSKQPFDLVLLDICMPGFLGTEVAKEIRHKNQHTAVIFVTTSPEFAVEAFALNAIHYIIKPFTETQFNAAMDRAMFNMQEKLTQMIQLKCPKGIYQMVDIDQICYIESRAHRQQVYLLDETTIETVQTLIELHQNLEALSLGQFIQPYKGYIVNQQFIVRIEPQQIVLKNQTSIPIPRRTFNTLKKSYFEYMFKGRP